MVWCVVFFYFKYLNVITSVIFYFMFVKTKLESTKYLLVLPEASVNAEHNVRGHLTFKHLPILSRWNLHATPDGLALAAT